MAVNREIFSVEWKFSYRQKFIKNNLRVYKNGDVITRVINTTPIQIITKLYPYLTKNQPVISFISKNLVKLLLYTPKLEIYFEDKAQLDQIFKIVIDDGKKTITESLISKKSTFPVFGKIHGELLTVYDLLDQYPFTLPIKELQPTFKDLLAFDHIINL